MARRTFDVVDVTEMLIHWHARRSQSEIAVSLGVDRKTVRKYLAPAIPAGMRPGDRAVGKAEWEQLVRGWFPGLVDTRLRQVTCERSFDGLPDLVRVGHPVHGWAAREPPSRGLVREG